MLVHGPANRLPSFPAARFTFPPSKTPVGFITIPGHISADMAQRLKDELRQLYSGVPNPPRFAILTDGTTVTFTPMDGQS